MTRSTISNREILEAALVGLTSRLNQTDAAIIRLRTQLGQRDPGRPRASMDGTGQDTLKHRTMSAAARRRIGLAQKRRWMLARKQKLETKQPFELPKRKISAAGRRAMSKATKVRWRKFRKEQKAAA
jgi:hypothetical protein